MAELDDVLSGEGEGSPTTDRQDTQPTDTQPQGGERQAGQAQESGREANPLQPALDAERGKSRRYKDELAEIRREFSTFRGEIAGFMQASRQPQPAPQPPPQAPDFWANPEAAIGHYVKQAMEARPQQDPRQREPQADYANARLIAEARFTPGAVSAAQEAFDDALREGRLNPADHARVMRSPNPFAEAVSWHESQPDTIRAKIEAEVMARYGITPGQAPNGQQPSPQPGAQPQPMPSSFAGARSSGPRTAQTWAGPKPMSELFSGR